MYEFIQTEAAARGFEKVFFLPSALLPEWKAAEEQTGVAPHLHWDPAAGYPKATCFLLVVFPYSPFDPTERISAYYLASQKSYHAVKDLVAAIAEQGVYCELADVPARAFALKHGIGVQGKNGLLRLPGYGSRIAVYVIATDACLPMPETWAAVPCPDGCTVCYDACPFHAIGREGLCVTECMRYHMQGTEYPEAVYEKQISHMGCEVCQHVCPHNAPLKRSAPTEEVRRAFDLRRLVEGDTKAARELVGRNKTGNGKLTVEAIRFAARQGLYRSEIEKALETSPFPAVQRAAEAVLQRNFTET